MRASPCLPLLLLVLAPAALANTAIETETAQIGEQGEIGTSNSVEYEHAPDGIGVGTLTQFEYGITDRSEILIEPFFYEAVHPTDGTAATHGAGDLEITPSYEIIQEKEDKAVPAVLLAFKLKVPTGVVPENSTGKFDYYPYVIVGKHFLGLTFNGNVGVDFQAPTTTDTPFHEQLVWDLELEKNLGEMGHWTVFIEGYSAEEGIISASGALEYNLQGAGEAAEEKHRDKEEQRGKPSPSMALFTAVAYDADGSLFVRPGINFDFF